LFKVGDIIIGKPNSNYSYTNKDGTMEVVKIYNNEQMRVKIIDHKVYDSQIGAEYDVDNSKKEFEFLNKKRIKFSF